MQEIAEGFAFGDTPREGLLDRPRLAERHEILRPLAEQLTALVAEHRLGALRKVRTPVGIGLPHVLAGRFDHVAKALLALGEHGFRALALVNVGDGTR